MFLMHQIVNVLINPVFAVLTALGLGWMSLRLGRKRLGKAFFVCAGISLFAMSWRPWVDLWGIWLERDYPVASVEECMDADAIVILGGGISIMPPEEKYMYPLMADAADRLWHGVRLWRILTTRHPECIVKIYCSGPDVSLSTLPLLKDFGVPADCVVPFDEPKNTEQEAKQYETVLMGKKVLLVTSAMHMKRALKIFSKYASSIEIVPAATDHHFLMSPKRFTHWQYWLPNLEALDLFSAVEHELVGLLRYAW